MQFYDKFYPNSRFSNYQLTTEGIPLKANITGLEPSTNYYYCAVASNNPGDKLNITYGNVVKFRTANPPPENTNTGIISRSTDPKIDLIKNVQTYPAPEELLTDTEAIFGVVSAQLGLWLMVIFVIQKR